jgi:Ribosomal protein S12
MGKNKPNGLFTARKLVNIRRKNSWKPKLSKKKRTHTYHSDPFLKSGTASGIVISKIARLRKDRGRPNYGSHCLVLVQLKKVDKKVLAKVPYDGGLNYIDENDEVLLCKVRKGKNIGDIDSKHGSVKYKVVKVNNHSMIGLIRGKFDRRSSF